MALRRRDRAASTPDSVGDLPPCAFKDRWPALWSFLGESQYEDGSERQLGTMLVCVGDGRARCWLNDKDAGLTAWLSADTLEGLLDAANESLEDDSLEWRKAKPAPGKKR